MPLLKFFLLVLKKLISSFLEMFSFAGRASLELESRFSEFMVLKNITAKIWSQKNMKRQTKAGYI